MTIACTQKMAIRGLGFVDPENRVGEATAYTQQV